MLRRILRIPKKVTIEWSYPKKVDEVLNSLTLEEENWGLYQISTKIDKQITFLYIGKSWKDYHKRIKDHKKKWFINYEGEKYVRFGSFITPINKVQLGEIESAIIFETQLPQNTQCLLSYTLNHDYEITSIGNRGVVPELIKTEVY
jgi:predicted GIY-YIG superfamily endonuclease